MNIKLFEDLPQNIGRSEYYDDLTPLQRVLVNRGLNGNIEEFFEHDWSIVQSPYDLDYIEAAAEKLLNTIKTSDKPIPILVDADTDGFTASAVLINYFNLANRMLEDLPKPNFVPIHHETKTHGLSDEIACKKMLALSPELIIIPDASGSREEYNDFNKKGIDIIVLDHHSTSEKGDGVHTIVVNNQHSEKYRNKSLSGVGVVYQFCNVLDDKLQLGIADNWLPLVALGLVADVMDLRNPETRFLVREGFSDEYEIPPFIEQVMFLDTSGYNFKEGLTPHSVAWYIGPKFNAVTRISPLKEREEIFLSLIDDQAHEEIPSGKRGSQGVPVERAVEAVRLASNAQSRQSSRRKKLADKIDTYIRESGAADHTVIIVPIDDFNADERALAGLAAAELSDQYQRPVMVIFRSGDEYSGSVRAPEGIEAFRNFKDQCEESSYPIFCAGHPNAFGIGLVAADLDDFIEYFDEKYEDIETDKTYYVDFSIDGAAPELPDIIEDICKNRFWGQGIKEPVVAVTNIRVSPYNIALMGKRNDTIKITLKNGVELMIFKTSKEVFDSFYIPPEEVDQAWNITIVGEPEINEFRGKITPQINIKDYEINGIDYVF